MSIQVEFYLARHISTSRFSSQFHCDEGKLPTLILKNSHLLNKYDAINQNLC